MNHKQWEALKAQTAGHTLRRWHVEWIDQEGGGYYILCVDGGENPARKALAAAAPALLEDNKRLREWLMVISREAPTLRMVYMAESAINGAEVPK